MSEGTTHYTGVRLRAAIYGRYSSDMQRPASLEDQERNCRALATEKGWIVLDEYVRGDRAMTGKMAKNRPSLNFLIDSVQRRPRPFDVLIIDELSRLGRKLKNVLELSDLLKHYGVKLYVVSQKLDSGDPSFSLLITFSGMMDEQNSDSLRHRVLRGQEGRVRKGYSSGSRCFGYRSEMEMSADQSLQGRAAILGVRWAIVEEQAKTIRRIHEMFADGMSTCQISRQLNEEGVPAAREPKIGSTGRKVWNSNLIKKILSNEKYNGKIVWRKTSQVIHPISEKIDTKKNPEESWVTVDAPHLRIVPQPLWDRSQERLKIVNEKMTSYRLGGLNRAKKRTYLFSGLLYCGECGSPMTIGATTNRRAAYSCTSARYNRGCKNKVWIREDRLNVQLLQALANNLLTSESMGYFIGSVAYELECYYKGKTGGTTSSLEDLMDREADLKNQSARLVQAIAHSASINSLVLPKQLAEVEAKLKEVRVDIQFLKAAGDSKGAKRDIGAVVRDSVENLLEVVQLDVLKGREVLQRHINRLVLVPIISEGGLTYEIMGDIDLFRTPDNRDGRILLDRWGTGTVQQYTGDTGDTEDTKNTKAVDFIYRFAGLSLNFVQDPWPSPLIAPLSKLLEDQPELLHEPMLAKDWVDPIKSMLEDGAMLAERLNGMYIVSNFRQCEAVFAREFDMERITINRDTYYMFRRLAAAITPNRVILNAAW